MLKVEFDKTMSFGEQNGRPYQAILELWRRSRRRRRPRERAMRQSSVSPSSPTPADVAVITRTDLPIAADFDRAALANIQSARFGMLVFEASAKTGQGMDGVMAIFETMALKKAAVSQPA